MSDEDYQQGYQFARRNVIHSLAPLDKRIDTEGMTCSKAVKNQWNGMVEWNTGME